MEIKQGRKDYSLGLLWECKEEMTHIPTKKSVECLISLINEYKPIDVFEIIEMIHELKYMVESNNYCYDENLSFDLSDVKRAIEREYKLKKSKTDSSIYKGGRPSKIKEYLAEYMWLKEGHTFAFKDEGEFFNVAKNDLSRTSFWRLQKEIKQLQKSSNKKRGIEHSNKIG